MHYIFFAKQKQLQTLQMYITFFVGHSETANDFRRDLSNFEWEEKG